MNAERLLAHYEHIADAPDAIPRLRRFVLDLAVRGKLVPQDSKDEPATDLLKRITAEKSRRVKEGNLRVQKALPPITEEEKEFELCKGWQWARVGDVIKLWNGFAFKSGDFQTKGIPVIRIGDLQGGEVVLSEAIYVSEVVAKSVAPEIWIPPDALLIAMSGATTGKTAFNRTGRQLLLNQRVGRIEVFLASVHFIRFFFETIIARNLSISFGTAIPNLSAQQINETVLALPPLAEQHRILAKSDELMALCDRLEGARAEREATRDRLAAASLARLNVPDPDTFRDDARFALEALPALTTRPNQIKQLRQTILNLAVRGKVVPQDPNDEPASELLKHLSRKFAKLVEDGVLNKPKPLKPIAQGDHLFQIPSGWALARFNQIASIQSNLVDPKRYKDMPHIAPDNIESWTARLLPYVSIREAGVFSGKHLFPAGSILYSKIRPNLAKVAKVDFDGLCSADMYPIHALIDGDFIVRFMITQDFVSQAVSEDNRVAMPKINQAALSDILVPVPPLAEQRRIVTKVDELMALCDRLETSLTTTDDTRHLLLDALLAEALAPPERELAAAE
jgi:type I restriction enzyme, S subunit